MTLQEYYDIQEGCALLNVRNCLYEFTCMEHNGLLGFRNVETDRIFWVDESDLARPEYKAVY